MKKRITQILILTLTLANIHSVASAKSGDIIGYAKYSDISAYINHYPITSYNINDNTAVVAEDLQNYGFNADGTAKHVLYQSHEIMMQKV